ncbi:MAG: translation initiation factor [Bacteroidales bacterium]|nr:translation initiation factor [Bacteroidales bacterium]
MMSDWKEKLAALGGVDHADEETVNEQKIHSKKKKGVVYSTNPNYVYEEEESAVETLPKNQQKLRLNMERAGRGGKTVTLIKGFVGSDEDIQALCKLLKQRCGVGGAVKDGEIIIQGDHRQRLVELLKKEGYSQTK